MGSWLGAPEFKVGFLVVAVSGMIGIMAMKVSQGPGLFGGQRQYYFRADSAGGLVRNSAVKMAGIKIGVIRDIVLEDNRARIIIDLDGTAKLTEGTQVELKADGILGDKHVELIPGKPDASPLAQNSELPTIKAGNGIDDVMVEVNRVAKSMNELLATLNKATKEGDHGTQLGRILGNIEQITADLKDVTGENKGKINEIVERVRNLAKNVDTYINEESLARVDRSLKNIEEITAKINRGEGTLGKLLNDEKTVEELNTAITNVNKFLGGADKLETSIDFHSDFMFSGQNKSFLGVRLQPGLDRYYELDIISNSRGLVTNEEWNVTQGGVTTRTDYRKSFKNQFEITGLFAKNFWDFTLKGGVIESAGGVGIDYRVLGMKDLTLSAEFYNFTQLQIRAFARYNFFKGMYIEAGGDNLASKGDYGASSFVGAGLFITNDDLKVLAAKIAL